MGRMLIGLGVALILLGLLVHYGGRSFMPGRLPGDFVFQKGNFTFYFPIVTSLLLSLLLTAVFWFFRKL